MLLYLGIIAVVFITSEVANIYEISKIGYNNLDLKSYCNNSDTVCVAKCCDKDEILNSDGVCVASSNIGIDTLNHHVTMYHWNETAVPKKTNEKYDQSNNNKFFYEFYILEDGSLKLKEDDERTDKCDKASHLHFCLDYPESDVNNLDSLLAKLAETNNKGMDYKLVLVTAGMAVTIFSLTIAMYRLEPRLLRILGAVMMAYTFAITASYTFTALQSITTRVPILGIIGCRVISPIIYFSILSGIFFVNMFFYEAFWKVRQFRKYGIKFDDLAPPIYFVRHCVYVWSIPLLMTIIVTVVEMLKMNKLMHIEMPPLDWCFTNETQMSIFLYLPVAILLAINCVLFFMNIYNILRLQRVYPKSIVLTKQRFTVCLVVVTLVLLSCGLELVPAMPAIVTIGIRTYSVLVGGTLSLMLIYEMFTYNPMFESNNIYEKLKEILKNSSILKTSTVDSNHSTDSENSDESMKIAMVKDYSANKDLTLNKENISFKI